MEIAAKSEAQKQIWSGKENKKQSEAHSKKKKTIFEKEK